MIYCASVLTYHSQLTGTFVNSWLYWMLNSMFSAACSFFPYNIIILYTYTAYNWNKGWYYYMPYLSCIYVICVNASDTSAKLKLYVFQFSGKLYVFQWNRGKKEENIRARIAHNSTEHISVLFYRLCRFKLNIEFAFSEI